MPDSEHVRINVYHKRQRTNLLYSCICCGLVVLNFCSRLMAGKHLQTGCALGDLEWTCTLLGLQFCGTQKEPDTNETYGGLQQRCRNLRYQIDFVSPMGVMMGPYGASEALGPG